MSSRAMRNIWHSEEFRKFASETIPVLIFVIFIAFLVFTLAMALGYGPGREKGYTGAAHYRYSE